MTALEVISALIAIMAFIISSAVFFNMKRVEEKINTLWDFQIRRGKIEALDRDIATMNSPVKVKPDYLNRFSVRLKDEIRKFYRTLPRQHLTDAQLAFELERRFGDRVMEEFCIPNKIMMGACLVICLQIARESN